MSRTLLSRLRWPLLGGAAAALLLATTTALAGSGVGATLDLGVANSVDAQTTLSGNPGANFLFRFTGTGTAATVRADAGTGAAINGVSDSGTGQAGQSTSGTGVQGAHAGSTGTAPGVEGRTSSTSAGAVGVLGRVTSASAGADSAGVSGVNTASSSNGFGVAGLHQGTGVGVFGHSANGSGVVGQSGSGVGVHGLGTTSGVLAELSGTPPTTSAAVEALVSGHGQGLHVHRGGGFFGDAVGILVEDILPALRVTVGSPLASSSVGLIEATNDNRLGRAVVGTATAPLGVGLQGQGDSGVGVLGKSTTGLAGRFEGDVHVTGKLTRAFTAGTANQAAPVAYAAVTNGGSTVANASTPNVSSTFDSVNKRYVITITGESYDLNHFVTQVTPINTAPRMVATQSSGGKLHIRFFDLTGAAVQSPFGFMTYKP